MNYAQIKKTDIANGTGVRVSLFVSGCRHRCKNCFNPETWDFGYGALYTYETEQEIIKALQPDYIAGFSVLGGDPLEPENIPVISDLIKKIRKTYPKKSIWVYTGYDFECDLLSSENESVSDMLKNIDVLVDGEFMEELKVIDLRFRGSTNQRIIDVKRSLRSSQAVLWE